MKSTNKYDFQLGSTLCPTRVSQPFSECADAAASAGGFQNVTSQLVVSFRDSRMRTSSGGRTGAEGYGELTARVRELLWRPGLGASWMSDLIQVGDLKLDLEHHMLWRDDDEIHLSPKEFDLLAFMMKNVDVILTHVKLLRSVWGIEYGGELEYLRTYVYTLRKKIEKNPANPEYIVSEPWIGYRFRISAGGLTQ